MTNHFPIPAGEDTPSRRKKAFQSPIVSFFRTKNQHPAKNFPPLCGKKQISFSKDANFLPQRNRDLDGEMLVYGSSRARFLTPDVLVCASCAKGPSRIPAKPFLFDTKIRNTRYIMTSLSRAFAPPPPDHSSRSATAPAAERKCRPNGNKSSAEKKNVTKKPYLCKGKGSTSLPPPIIMESL